MTVAGVGDDQCLHGHWVLFHQVGNAGVGVDDDLISESHPPLHVVLLIAQEGLAVTPVVIHQRHAYRGVGIEHLLGADDFYLVRVGIQPVFFRQPRQFPVVNLQ